MNTNEEKFYNNCFTEIEEGKINAEFNKATMKCFDSEDNKFSMDCEGNLVVNSIITRESTPTANLTIDQIYPIGSIYMSMEAINPGTLFGGVWERIKDRFLLGVGDFYSTVNKIGGEANHLLTQAESGIREHTHKLPLSTSVGIGSYDDIPSRATNSGNVDGSFRTGRVTAINNQPNDYGAEFIEESLSADAVEAHNNMPPYLTTYIWKRVS